MKWNLLVLALFGMLFLAGCTDIPLPGDPGTLDNSDSRYARASPAVARSDSPIDRALSVFPSGAGYAEEVAYAPAYEPALYPAAPSYTDALQIKEATIRIQLERGQLEDKFKEARGLLNNRGAEIVSIFYDENEYTGQKTYAIAFRILPAQFDETLEELKSLGEVQDINIDVEDVTRQYTNLAIRLTNKELELQRLQQLYDRSETVEDLLAVESELARITTEIEQLQSEKETLEKRVATSKITLELFEETAVSEAKEGDFIIRANEGQLDTALQALQSMVSDERGEIASLQFTESSYEKRYAVLVRLDPLHLEAFLERVRGLGEVKYISTTIDEENRPEKSLIAIDLVEEKSAIQTNLLVPLETLLQTFFGALSTGLLILVGLAGFLLPAAILIWVAYAIYKRMRKAPGPAVPIPKK